jgi:hypothetical protein
MASATLTSPSTPDAAVKAAASPADQSAATGTLAIAYTPEVIDAVTASVPPGAFAISVINSIGEFERLSLEPGLNFGIDADLWHRLQVLPAVQQLNTLRALEVIPLGGNGVGDTAAAGVTALKGVEEKQALRLVHVCRDLKQLQTWHPIEERHAVRQAIQRKINAIKAGQG